MNWYRHQVIAALGDTRPGFPSATVLLQKLHADHRDIGKAIRHLQRVQRLRERRLDRFGTLDLSFTLCAAETLGNTQPRVRIARAPGRATN